MDSDSDRVAFIVGIIQDHFVTHLSHTCHVSRHARWLKFVN